MYKCITFSIPNQFDNFFHKIIKDTNLNNQLVLFEDFDIIKDELSQITTLQNDCHYNVKEILKEINNKYYILFIKALFSYNENSNLSIKISSLDDFLNSQYTTIIFITDSTIVNIITKDNMVFEQIKNNALNFSFRNIDIKENGLPYNIFDYK